MDPTTCYHEMLDALHQNNLDTARERAVALQDWLNRGGFYPAGRCPEEVRQRLRETLRRTTIES